MIGVLGLMLLLDTSLQVLMGRREHILSLGLRQVCQILYSCKYAPFLPGSAANLYAQVRVATPFKFVQSINESGGNTTANPDNYQGDCHRNIFRSMAND
jgi:hypothetical protein